MLDRYKLRLRDGTVLVVDHDALSTWLVDGKAMVQLVGSDRWLSLRQFLAKERALAKSASWPSPTPAAAIAPTRKPPDDEGAPRPGRILPLPAAPPLPAPVEEAAPAAESISSPPEAEEEVSITVPVAEEGEAAPPAASPIITSEPPLSVSEPPEVWVPSEEAAPPPESAESVLPEEPADEVALTAPAAVEAEVPALADTSGYTEEPPLAPSEPREVWVPSEEAAELASHTTSLSPPPEDDGSVEPVKLLEEEDVRPWRSLPPVRTAPRVPQPSRDLQVLAEDTVVSSARSGPPRATPSQGLPVIGLKPLEDDVAPWRAAAAPEIYEEYEGEVGVGRAMATPRSFLGLEPPWDARVDAWLDFLSTWVARLGRGLDWLVALLGRLRSKARSTTPPAIASAALRLVPAEAEAPGTATRWPSRVAGAIAGASAWARALPRRARSAASRWTEQVRRWLAPGRDGPLSWAEGPAASAVVEPARKPAAPPTPITELPVLRLAKIDEPEAEPDQDIYREPGFLDAAWLWMKRLTLVAGLLTGGIIAASTWETWLPAAAQFGRMIFLEIDKRVHPGRALDAERSPTDRETAPWSPEQLPHLAPETIALLSSRSRAGPSNPPEVFARAYDALERGRSALNEAESQELGALQRALMAALRPAERQRIRQYELARARRATAPAEDREVLGLFARGARTLPSWGRERLQELSGKAITAGLALPADASPRAAAGP